MKDFANMVKVDPFGNSFLIYNSNEAINKLSNWKKNLPWITPYYAIKSNPIKPLIQDLVNNAINFDCASKGEIKLVLQNGVAPHNIIYSNPIKTEKDLKWAAKQGVQFTTADTFDELVKIKSLAPKMKVLWRISIKEDNPELLATVFSGKFGDDITSVEEATERFQRIKDYGINLYGIHFHCGSAQQGSPSFGKAVDLARACMEIGRSLGHDMKLLDVGGGFPSEKLNDNVINALGQTRNDPLGYNVIAEPGRHFSSSSCMLAFRILARRFKSGKLCYHVNESLYHSFNCNLMDGVTFEDKKDQFYAASDSQGREIQIGSQQWCSLFGMTCDGRDVIANNLTMPSDLEVGDWIVMGGMGSYTYGPRSRFNGMKSTTKIHSWKGEMCTQHDNPVGNPQLQTNVE